MKLSALLSSILAALPSTHALRAKVADHCRSNSSILESIPLYPDTYLHIRECRSGQEWIMPIQDDDSMDLETLINQWCALDMGGELELDGKIQPRLEGDYYAQIKTDGSAPDSPVCWNSGGFWLKTTY
jgi:hypothetical protein